MWGTAIANPAPFGIVKLPILVSSVASADTGEARWDVGDTRFNGNVTDGDEHDLFFLIINTHKVSRLRLSMS